MCQGKKSCSSAQQTVMPFPKSKSYLPSPYIPGMELLGSYVVVNYRVSGMYKFINSVSRDSATPFIYLSTSDKVKEDRHFPVD